MNKSVLSKKKKKMNKSKLLRYFLNYIIIMQQFSFVLPLEYNLSPRSPPPLQLRLPKLAETNK